MYFFSYGIVAEQYNSNVILKRGLDVIAKNAWVKGALYDSELGFNVMTSGEDRVKGMLFTADEEAMLTIKGITLNFQSLKPNLELVLKQIVVYTENVSYEAQVFICEKVEGMQKISDN